MTRLPSLILVFPLLFGSCTPQGPTVLTVMTHDSFAISEDVIYVFEESNNVTVIFLPSGDAGSMLNKAILTKDAPFADVLFGVDNTFLSRALDEDLFESYASAELQSVSDEFELDPSYRVTPVDYGDVCINYDKNYFVEKGLAVPQTLKDLTKAEYYGLLVVENPATSSTGLAFLLATVAYFGETFSEYWRELKDNGVVVVDSWETAYYTNFSGSSGRGPQPLVVSYRTSPVAEVVFASPPIDDAPTASIDSPGSCFRQIEFVGILKGTKNRALAETFIDFMLAEQFQADMPTQMFVLPVNSNASVPLEFNEHLRSGIQPATLDHALIAANRDAWIQVWTNAVLK